MNAWFRTHWRMHVTGHARDARGRKVAISGNCEYIRIRVRLWFSEKQGCMCGFPSIFESARNCTQCEYNGMLLVVSGCIPGYQAVRPSVPPDQTLD